jgi:hypothetical protein
MSDTAQGRPFVILVQIPNEALDIISEGGVAPGQSPVMFEGFDPPPPPPIIPDVDFSPFG